MMTVLSETNYDSIHHVIPVIMTVLRETTTANITWLFTSAKDSFHKATTVPDLSTALQCDWYVYQKAVGESLGTNTPDSKRAAHWQEQLNGGRRGEETSDP
jgi:hypothetical protein